MKLYYFLISILLLGGCITDSYYEGKADQILSSFLKENKMKYEIIKCDSIYPYYILSTRAYAILDTIHNNNRDLEYIDTISYEGKINKQNCLRQNDSLIKLITKADSTLDMYTFSAEVVDLTNKKHYSWVVQMDTNYVIDTIAYQKLDDGMYVLIYPYKK